MDYTKQIGEYTQKMVNEINKLDVAAVNQMMDMLVEARDNDRYVFIMGNGGSGGTASHIAGDFNKGLSLGRPREKRYKFISLGDNAPTVLSLANDVSYNDVVRDILAFCR